MSALEALSREHSPAVYRYARLYLDPHDAEEVVAEVFAIAWRRCVDAPDDPRAWLLGVARKVMANHLRGWRRRKALLERLGRYPAPEPADGVSAINALADLRTAVAQLRPADRQVIALLAAGELNTAELAEALGISRDAAAARIKRARSRLRAVYPLARERSDHG